MPNITVAVIILFGLFFGMMLLKVSVSFSLGISAMVTAFYLKVPILVIAQQMVKGVEINALLAIPFFILVGEIMSQGGISERLVNFSNVILGRLRGGLALVDVLACMFFGGISGSAIADVSSVGSIMIPMMKKKGYDADYSVSVTVTSATQGILVPPSHNMILYSIVAGGVSIGALFLAGILPAAVLCLAVMITAYIISVKRKYPKEEKYTLKEALKITRGAILGLFTPIIILVGVVSGIFTATESGAIACVYSMIVTFAIYRKVPVSQLKSIIYRTLKTMAIVMTLIATANAFGWVLAYLGVPALMTKALLSVSSSKVVILLLINLLLLFLGCIMDMTPLILIMTPILLPVATALGLSPVHFGIILLLNLAIGLCTPPVGSALFVGCAIGKMKIGNVMKSILPFYVSMFVVLMLVTYIPEVSSFLPKLFMLGK
ncbi:MAG TPA: hypothetical protein DDW50_06110 [Firmicutes bacterium]|nr:hypothetical protein [Bacillota bacterium]